MDSAKGLRPSDTLLAIELVTLSYSFRVFIRENSYNYQTVTWECSRRCPEGDRKALWKPVKSPLCQ